MIGESDIEKNRLYREDVLAFVTASNDLCKWLEDLNESKAEDFIQVTMHHLSGIFHLVTAIEPREPVLEGGNEKYVTESDWSDIYKATQQLLGSHNTYLRIAGSEEFDRSDLVPHTISEDLADIYQDLKDFTMQYRQGIEEIMNDALWEVQSNFEQYWGVKVLNSLGALHSLYRAKTDLRISSSAPLEDDQDDMDIPKYDNSFFTRLQDLNEEET